MSESLGIWNIRAVSMSERENSSLTDRFFPRRVPHLENLFRLGGSGKRILLLSSVTMIASVVELRIAENNVPLRGCASASLFGPVHFEHLVASSRSLKA
jgi:hypothetical protein